MKQRSILILVGLGLASLILIVAWLLKLGYDESIRGAQVQADNLVQGLQGQFSSTFRRAHSDLEDIAERLQPSDLDKRVVSGRALQLEALLQGKSRRFPQMRGYYIWDANGDFLYGSRKPPQGQPLPSLVSNAAFNAARDNPRLNLVFSDTIRNPFTGHWDLGIALPVRDARGKFRGIVTGSIELEQLASDIEHLDVPEGSRIFLRRSDNHQLVYRQPFVASMLNKPVRSPIQERIDLGEMAGQARFSAVSDGEKRLYSFRQIQPYPFYIVVGLAEDEVLREWQQSALIATIILVIMAVAVVLILRRALQADEARQDALLEARKAHALLQEAIDTMSAGMIIYDPSDRLVMCNLKYREALRGIINDSVVAERTSFEELAREGVRRGVLRSDGRSDEEWLKYLVALHRQADGRAYEIEYSEGRWLQINEHRTPSGYWVGSRIDITGRKRLEADLREQASTDVLTGLANRRYFLTRLEEELERVRRQTTREALVMMLDLDHFKRINDLLGHATGDGVLRHFADVLRNELRAIDTAGRFGGEEFAVILPGSSRQSAQACAQRICDRVASLPLKFAGLEVRITVSIGLSALLPEDLTSDAVLIRADHALYQAKASGRNRVQLASD